MWRWMETLLRMLWVELNGNEYDAGSDVGYGGDYNDHVYSTPSETKKINKFRCFLNQYGKSTINYFLLLGAQIKSSKDRSKW